MENDTRRLKVDIAKKIIKIILKIIYQIFIVLCIIMTIIIVLQKVTNSNRTIFGYRIFRVITGSMKPEYDVGEIVICKEVDPKNIKIGDDIVYVGKYGDYNGKIIMHEVIAIDVDGNNELNFHAKGLHTASVEDPQIKPDQILGVVKFKSEILTILYKLATSTYSAFIIISILVLNVFISFKFSNKEGNIQQLNEANEEYIENNNQEEIEINEEIIENNENVEDNIKEDIEDDVEEDVDDENQTKDK